MTTDLSDTDCDLILVDGNGPSAGNGLNTSDVSLTSAVSPSILSTGPSGDTQVGGVFAYIFVRKIICRKNVLCMLNFVCSITLVNKTFLQGNSINSLSFIIGAL